MAHRLELRFPFVDKEIVEYVERLPANLKVRSGSREWLHRLVCQYFLPGPMLSRPKRGFATNVIEGWYRSALDSKMTEIFLDDSSRIYQYLEARAVRGLFDRHSSGRQDNHKLLLRLTALEEWLRAYHAPLAALRSSMGRVSV
jgi:asparagine synthase (glutamine-hydrolysing)